MKITETLNEGLRRGYSIVITAKELDKKVDEKLNEAQPNIEMKGFRKGKVPMAMLKKQFGPKVLGEAMQETVDGAMNKHFEKSGDRPAIQPDVKITNEDWKDSYSKQSQKFLNINSIQINNLYPEIEIKTSQFEKENFDLLVKGKKIAFGIDSFEDYKMWYEEDFVELANLLYEKKLFDYIYLICGPEKSYLADKMINLSQKKFFINCSQKNLTGIILALKNSDFFVGNNSGPLNLAAALKVKSFGLIANDPITELEYSKIEIIRPDDLPDDYRLRDRTGMKKLRPKDVFEKIIKNL